MHVAAEHRDCSLDGVAWEKMAAVLVRARLCEPSSELHIAQDWYRRTSPSAPDSDLGDGRAERGELVARETNVHGTYVPC